MVEITESSKFSSNFHNYTVTHATPPQKISVTKSFLKKTKHTISIRPSNHSSAFIMEEQTTHSISMRIIATLLIIEHNSEALLP